MDCEFISKQNLQSESNESSEGIIDDMLSNKQNDDAIIVA
jgi:hypothetical protein